MLTREEYLARCREAAIAPLDAGDSVGAIALMISDLRKANEPLYDEVTLRLFSSTFFSTATHRSKFAIGSTNSFDGGWLRCTTTARPIRKRSWHT